MIIFANFTNLIYVSSGERFPYAAQTTIVDCILFSSEFPKILFNKVRPIKTSSIYRNIFNATV